MHHHRSQILGCLAAMLAPSAAPAGVCFPYDANNMPVTTAPPVHPGALVLGVSGHSLASTDNGIPFAGIWVAWFDLVVGGYPPAPEQGAAECHERAGMLVAQADDTTDLTPASVASSASYDAQIVDGRLDLAALAGFDPVEAVQNEVGSPNAEVELGFREVFDVASAGLEMRDLQIDWSLAGSWSQLDCSPGGDFHQPPYRELRLKVFSDPTPIFQPTLKVLDINFSAAPGAEVLEFERLDTAQVHPNALVTVELWFKVRAFVTQQNTVGDETCFGGDSNAAFSGPDEGLSIAFHNPDPNASIVPRSGIEYSESVPEPGGAALGAAALAALGALGRRATRLL